MTATSLAQLFAATPTPEIAVGGALLPTAEPRAAQPVESLPQATATTLLRIMASPTPPPPQGSVETALSSVQAEATEDVGLEQGELASPPDISNLPEINEVTFASFIQRAVLRLVRVMLTLIGNAP
jgi:hypothetical protein